MDDVLLSLFITALATNLKLLFPDFITWVGLVEQLHQEGDCNARLQRQLDLQLLWLTNHFSIVLTKYH